MRRLTLVLALLALCLLAAPAAGADGPGCLHGDERLTERDRAGVERALLCLTNVFRARQHLAPLHWDGRLAGAARAHSEDMHERDYFGHTSADGSGPTERAAAWGFSAAGGEVGENIGFSVTGTAHSLFIGWQRDEEARALLLEPDLEATGPGVAACPPSRCGAGGILGTQMVSYEGADSGFTGLDLYVADPRECLAGRAARRAARRALARVRKALATASSPERRSSLRRKLRRKRARLEAARARVTTACAGQSP
ncbi:MAG TPA: CAP domain-containing protein [Solirubrobacterales bacterium]|nr:CAP domain-containing protein [Solirubrobacterales bacterium]